MKLDDVDGRFFMTVDPILFKSYFNKQFYSEMPRTIYHYCSTDTFIKIINNSTIRLHDITKSNDSKEIIFYIVKLISNITKSSESVRTLGFSFIIVQFF